jgi:hypothetical protein
MYHAKFFCLAFLIFILNGTGWSQGHESQVNEPQIPELQQMHDYIRPMWHQAYPDKDIAMLKSLYSDLAASNQKLQSAAFPEEWADRQMHWQEGLKKMEFTLQAYKTAMDSGDDKGLLEAARKLHDAYEGLVMIVNPPIPEIDDFHKTLYHVYHDYLPNQNWEMVRKSIPEFEQKMTAIDKVVLPKWMGSAQEAFDTARRDLAGTVKELAKLKESGDAEQLEQAVENLHSAYERLQAVCFE